jgi:hypothetical protein
MPRHKSPYCGKSYKHYISNIAYRFGFQVIYEEGRISKEENGVRTVILESDKNDQRQLAWEAWRILAKEYKFSGIWTDGTCERIEADREKEAETMTPFVDFWNQLCDKHAKTDSAS